jgi:uncharacterized protein (UPF0276 family)
MSRKFLGFGLGLRVPHYAYVLENRPAVDWFEILSENYMVAGGKPRFYLHAIREHYPLVMHGVSLSVGSTDPLNTDYLKGLKTLIRDVEPEWISDHLCWTSLGEINSHDLLPLPYTHEALEHVVSRIQQVQDFLGRTLLLENVSSYISYRESEMTEWAFFNEVCTRAGCSMLLDINNIYVSARNHGFDPIDYLNGVTPQLVQQFHLAGHSDFGDYIIDTHDHDVPDPVWSLYAEALQRFGAVSTMIERDDDIPEFPVLFAELEHARAIARETLGNATVPGADRATSHVASG